MKISELIAQLESLRMDLGDVEVKIDNGRWEDPEIEWLAHNSFLSLY